MRITCSSQTFHHFKAFVVFNATKAIQIGWRSHVEAGPGIGVSEARTICNGCSGSKRHPRLNGKPGQPRREGVRFERTPLERKDH